MMGQMKDSIKSVGRTQWLWGAGLVLLLGALFSSIYAPDLPWLWIGLLVLFLGDLIFLAFEYRAALTSRSGQYGINSLVTILLVLGIVGVLNFFSHRYPQKLDLTRNQLHTLSPQTKKILRELDKDVKATFFAEAREKEKFRPLFENYRGESTHFNVEYVDPNKEPTRTRQLGIKQMNTLHLDVNGKTSRVEDVKEETVTNALIRLLQDKKRIFCAVTGHGEKSFESQERDGFALVKKELEQQAYEVKDVNLPQAGKIPEDCSVVAVVGPESSFFPKEISLVEEYLNGGGRALFALELGLNNRRNGGDDLVPLLDKWFITVKKALVVDPLSRLMGVDAAVPILALFSKEQAITKDFQKQCYFPFTRPVLPKAGAPASLKVQWIAKTSPKSWGETDLGSLEKGRVQFDDRVDEKGPVSAAVVAEGRLDPKGKNKTRILVFGSSQFAVNQYATLGGNLDFFLNGVSWLMEDDQFISIRSKESEAEKIELSQANGQMIFWLTTLLFPLFVVIIGGLVWLRRRKL